MNAPRLHAIVVALVAAAGLVGHSTPAHVEGLLTGYLGSVFGGDLESSISTYGVALGATAAGILGFEFDLSKTSSCDSITTAMGNLLVGAPGPIRPYETG